MNNKEASLNHKIWLSILCVLGAILVVSSLFTVFIISFPGIQDSIVFLKSMQALQTVAAFALPIVLLARHYYSKPYEFLGLKLPNALILFPLVIVFAFSMLPVINLLAEWNTQLHLPESLSSVEAVFRQMEASNKILMDRLLTVNNVWGLVGNILIIACLAAICEELLFRAWFQKLLMSKYGPHISIWVVGFFFSVIHFQFLGFFPRWLMGVMLGYIYYYSGSLYLSILAHFINNAFALIAYYLVHSCHVSSNLETIGIGDSSWLAILGFILATASMWLFIYVGKRTELIQKKESI